MLQLANALNSESLGESALVRIFWPKDRCNLLRDDVVLVDRYELAYHLHLYALAGRRHNCSQSLLVKLAFWDTTCSAMLHWRSMMGILSIHL